MSGIHCLAIPTPFRVGRVNCYLIDDDPLTLVDVGPNSAASMVALEAALAEHGRRVEDLERIVITHQHADHLGLVGILADRSRAEVCALDVLQPVVEDFNGYAERNDALRAGADAPPRRRARHRHRARRDVARLPRLGRQRARHPRAQGPGRARRSPNRSFQVLHRPGHSPTDTVFFDATTGR